MQMRKLNARFCLQFLVVYDTIAVKGGGRMRLDEKYFSAPATELAPDLIGKVLCRRLADGSVLRRRITETECYFGEEDTACHAHKGRTSR